MPHRQSSFSASRRRFITLLGGAAAAWPMAARAQQPAMPVIGFLGSDTPELYADRLHIFRQGLSETGYSEGRNVAIDYRWANGQYDRLPELAADLVRHRVAVIFTLGSSAAAFAAKGATSTIPIVFQIGSDPVANGLIASLSRPGSNLTGVTTLGVDITPKRLELLHEAVPAVTVVAGLINPTSVRPEVQSSELQTAGRRLGLQVPILLASTERDLDTVFATMPRLQAGALVISGEPFFASRSEKLAALALQHKVLAISQQRAFAVAGGLMSYGDNDTEASRLIGLYTGRILKGEKPADLPVQQVTKIELIINMKTAKTLGVTFPLTLLGRADEVIE
jgi:putative tryptophan/tyrosine transport system substrate-binding protein